MMENLDSNCTYAKAVIRSSSTPRIEQLTMDSCYIDEGYEDQSQNGIQRSSSLGQKQYLLLTAEKI